MKRITIEDFDNAVPEVAADITMKHLDKVEATVMYVMSGISFAKELREKLFKEEK